MRAHIAPFILQACKDNDLPWLREHLPSIQERKATARPHNVSVQALKGFIAACSAGHLEAAKFLYPALRLSMTSNHAAHGGDFYYSELSPLRAAKAKKCAAAINLIFDIEGPLADEAEFGHAVYDETGEEDPFDPKTIAFRCIVAPHGDIAETYCKLMPSYRHTDHMRHFLGRRASERVAAALAIELNEAAPSSQSKEAMRL